MHRPTFPNLLAPMLALCLLPAACDEDLGDEELAAQAEEFAAEDDDEDEDADDESRLLCFYGQNSPPSTNESDSLIGADDVVESNDEADGACDLHMFRVTADPPSDRARTIDFHATSMAPFDDYGALVWTKSCAGLVCQTNWSNTAVTLTVSGGGWACPTINDCIPLPYFLDGQLDLSATNSIVDIRAGMRASLANGTTVPVEITVSE